MEKFKIEGGRPLAGDITVSGAKNAALPELLCALLTDEELRLSNVPCLRDVKTSLRLLEMMGKRCSFDPERGEVSISGAVTSHVAPYDLVKTMRASILALGPLVSFCGHAEVSLPGGCSIGARPVDLHIRGLQEMGAHIDLDGGYIHAEAVGGRLHGARIVMDKVSVTGTENLMMAACLADGTTVIENAAREPEVVDLADCLRMMGAHIRGDGTATVEVQGVQRLCGGSHRVVADRIETGTYLVAAMATHGVITCHDSCPFALDAVLSKLRSGGAEVTVNGSSITLDMRNREIRPVDITTAPHPGFPTDMQAQFTVLNALACGTGSITETIFENRFMHIPELIRMGARLDIRGNTVICSGPAALKGAQVMATDLRASACLVIAGLAASGTTVVDRIYHMDRGYERIERKIGALGGLIERVGD
ncbi:MAG: UDP-N-acetylglucosamine 1-carboxyvinyltransferase [Succinivibrionaceae bacterium]|nr:UDP-N-acetylglucosamine 1-carboxyvinyltransferase [Succinivibrionaceae bacterium]